MAFMDIFKREAETKSTIDINSPRVLEMMRSGSQGGNAMRVSAVYSCVKVLSESISTLPVNLYTVDGDIRTKKTSQLDRLVSQQPNDSMTSSELWSYIVASVCLNGNAFVYVTRTSTGRAVELLPVPASSVTINTGNRHGVTYTVTTGGAGDSKTVEMTSKNLIHFKSLTLDGYTGISPIAYNSAVIDGSRSAVSFANSVYTNGSTPRGVLEVEGSLSDDAFENLRASWGASHGGEANANRVAILESGVKFSPISMTPQDVQLLESRKYSRSEIAGLFRVPAHMIGDLDKATYSNIGAQGMEFHRYSLAPWLTMIEQRLNMTLTPSGSNERFRFDVSELIRGDVEAEVAAYSKLLEIGVLNPNEVRGKFGMSPRDGGDEYISQTNNLSFGDSTEKPTEKPKENDDV